MLRWLEGDGSTLGRLPHPRKCSRTSKWANSRPGSGRYREYAAEGNGGQFVIVLPELDITVVITRRQLRRFQTWYPQQDLVAKYIIPAANKQ
jgi:hypothetical protein